MLGVAWAAQLIARRRHVAQPKRCVIHLRLRSWLDSPWVTAAFGIVVAILTWGLLPISPMPGLDASWILGLNMAAAVGADQGTDFVFTYGPLGFLEQPLVIDGLLATLGAIYLVVIRAALAASLLWAARRSFSWLAAAGIALVVAAVTPPAVGSAPLALTVLWCLVALQDPAPRWAGRAVIFGGGSLAALEALVKLNVGTTILALIGVTVLAIPGERIRNVLALLGVFFGSYSLLWLASGQGLANLDDYVRSSFEIVSGYQRAMQLDAPHVSWDWLAAAALGLGSIAATAFAASPLAGARRVAMLTIVGLLLFSLEKYGFVRHDAAHAGAFFGVLATVWVALRWRAAERFVACAAIALIALAYFPAANVEPGEIFRPRLALDQLRMLLIPGERSVAADAARAGMQAAYAVDPRIIERIGDAPVDARPWEIGLIWAYGLNWRPLPVIQDYSAYTPDLDRLDAEALSAASGPRFVLRHLGYDNSSLIGIDGRLTSFDSPLATRTLLCHFSPVLTTASYQLLERGGDRCGPERPLGTVTAAYGEPVSIPRPATNEAVLARIEGAGGEGIERLRTLAYREALRYVSLDRTQTRFQTATAPDGILLSAPRAADFPAPFGLALDPRTISIDSAGGFATSAPPLRYHFFALPIEPVHPPSR